jgi:hypothetical protein
MKVGANASYIIIIRYSKESMNYIEIYIFWTDTMKQDLF